ncbi:MAG: PEP-CTERM sorting domain-containing protein [Nitrospirae bacterium]|nr:PEP-CTERM sorting domain-containing protein [Nitrospirota bacterium]
MKKISIIIIALIIGLCLTPAVNAGSLFLEDWGVSPGNWTPTNAPANTKWVSEDYTSNGSGFLDPGWGGQPFDSEAAYIGFKNSKIYIAVVAGLPQGGSKDPWRYDNPKYNYYDFNRRLEKYWYDPGDIGLDLGNDGTFEYAITTRINNNNSTNTPTPGAGKLLNGNLAWTNPKAWEYNNVYTDWNGISNPWAVAGYSDAIDLGVNFSYSAFGTDHYVIEAIINSSLIGLYDWDNIYMHWVMECGNDNINLNAHIPPVPEPSTLILLGAGIFGLAFLRIKSRKKTAIAGKILHPKTVKASIIRRSN